jgi:type I restriction enzyme R subunit
MGSQSELELEEYLIQILTKQGYTLTIIHNEDTLLSNLKKQLEKLNQTQFSSEEFDQIRSHLSLGSVFEKANKLRGYFDVQIDNHPTKYIKFLNQDDYTQNTFQVIQQIKIQGKYQNRYDVTILINGLPLVQIELKRRGIELKEAFNQINRYHRDSYGYSTGLFQYIQIFIISNGVNTKYFANNKDQSFKQTFYWTDKDNQKLTEISQFASSFLHIYHIAKMISQYIVLTSTSKKLMILRPYQIYAVEAIVNQVNTSRENGYIWHTTGSGKTLTSFKTAQILVQNNSIDKVVFVVDRKDLDAQTTEEFNAFSEGCVDDSKTTQILVDQLLGKNLKSIKGVMKGKLIITTIQKLSIALKRNVLGSINNQRIIFIFDECHRSQFGAMHTSIKEFFPKDSPPQCFGFTGTPIFDENHVSHHTTKSIFQNLLHSYVIVDAINDQNVLPFSIDYVGKYNLKDSATEIDIETDGNIDTKEVLDSNERLNKIVDYIIAHHHRKTHNKEFSAIFAISSIEVLYEYYKLFKEKAKDLKVASIFSYVANEEDPNANGNNDSDHHIINESSRDKLEKIISDYNQNYGTSFSTKDQYGFQNYFRDISKRVKQHHKNPSIDILLVVNMFLTGFDSPSLNTIYVDKNLKYHGLIQAFSRTNRILNEKKSHGQVVCFRNLKQATDDAIALFSNPQAKSTIIVKDYKESLSNFNDAVAKILSITPTPNQVSKLKDEEQKLSFIQAFRDIIRMKNALTSFVDFDWHHLGISEQSFEDYSSKYLDLYDEIKRPATPKESILKDIDFLIELIHRDEINVSYILKLIDESLHKPNEEKDKQKQHIANILSSDPKLRSKKDLILAFIEEMNLKGNQGFILEDIVEAFNLFVDYQQKRSFSSLCDTENLDLVKTQEIIDLYLYDGRTPLDDDIEDSYLGIISLRERDNIIPRLRDAILQYIERSYFLEDIINS